MIPYKMIYTINMHTTVDQFWRFVYHHEQSVIDHYARISLYTLSFCTKIILHVYNLSWTRNYHHRFFRKQTCWPKNKWVTSGTQCTLDTIVVVEQGVCTLCTRMSSFVGGFSNFQIMGRGPINKSKSCFFLADFPRKIRGRCRTKMLSGLPTHYLSWY